MSMLRKNAVSRSTIKNCFDKAFQNEGRTSLNELIDDVDVPQHMSPEEFYNAINPEANFESDLDANLNLYLEDSSDEEESHVDEPQQEIKSTELMTMLQTLRTNLQTDPNIKQEWFNGIENVLVKKIESEGRVQPKITNFFSQSNNNS